MAHIVESGRGARRSAIAWLNVVLLAETIEHARHQMKGAERVSETRVFSSLISIETESELLNASKPLKLRRVDQAHH